MLRLRFPGNTSVAQIIEQRYGRGCVHSYRRYERLCKKLNKCNCDINFLTKCKAYNIIPKFLHFKLYKANLYNSKFYKKCQFKLLQNEINSKNKLLRTLNNQVESQKQYLKSSVSHLDFVYLNSVVEKSVQKEKCNIVHTHENKLKSLGITNNLDSLDPSKVIFNYSCKTLTPRQESLLAFGLNFKLPCFKIDFFRYFSSFENLCQMLSRFNVYCPVQTHSFNLKDHLKSIILKHFYNFKPWKVFSPIFSKSDIQILRNLSKDKSIVICRPDKGRGVVILNRHDYEDKMLQILNDQSKFEEIKEIDHLLYTLRSEDKINNKIRNLKKLKIIDDSLASTLTVSGSSPGVLYGLPKVHKTGVPLRPILAAYNTPSYSLSKYLVSILNHLTTNEYTINNSYEFMEFITNVHNDNYIMCSFDIKSLFTNIPLDETIQIILDQTFPNDDSEFNNFSKSHFKSTLQLATKNSFFVFNGKLYKQLDGVAMGTPCGPTLANIFLCYHEKKWLQDCPIDFKPQVYKRYVDDTFLLFRNETQIINFLN